MVLNGTMSPLLVPVAAPLASLMSILASIKAKPPLACAVSRDMPAGLPNTVLASSAEEARPAYAVPMPLALCSLSERPPAMAGVLSAVAMAAEIAVTLGSEKRRVMGIVLIASERGKSRDVGF